ncbi:MAG: diaminopimelate epimerase [Gemmatimonadaceae bacterium]|nr:diaminopimelate epimerase [Gemmatimonadaceae bacterium]
MTTRQFFKMSGSGNDFVVFDARTEPAGAIDDPVVIQALCARGTGVGADGLVFIEPATEKAADFRMRYFNADGSRAAMCGNATLCVTRLAADLGAGPREGMRVQTDSGIVTSRMVGASAEVDMAPVHEVRSDVAIELQEGEQRIGYAIPGVPHLVVLCQDVGRIDVMGRGRALRLHPAVRPHGANANFVSRREDGTWSIRTYERGVEAETLACGTGAIASAILLCTWGQSGLDTTLVTRSGRQVSVRLRRHDADWCPTLRGEARLVFTGELGDA